MGLVSTPPPEIQDAKPVNEAVSRISQPLQVLVAGPEVPVESLLVDLSLPTEFEAIISSVLAAQGYNLQPTEIEDFGGQTHTFSLVNKGREIRCLICIPDQILANPSGLNISAVYSIISLFPLKYKKIQSLYIFHENNPHVSYKYVLSGKWKELLGINIKLNPFSDIRDLKDLDEDRRDYSVLVMLELAVSKKNVGDISQKELIKLRDILAAFHTFRDGDGEARRAFISTAGIRDNLANFNFNGSPRNIAWSLISELLDFGESQEEPGKHVLGLLCEMLSSLPEIPRADKEVVDKLMLDYDFAFRK